ncbi:hypothetical protein ACJRO7_032347 [Eucalyptus globulus]|uniref:TIR domain-containing protein n=1 Tax=Eucalyptus globulus TaxID=34317 RepID=A0ABD3JIX4_EUCGL
MSFKFSDLLRSPFAVLASKLDLDFAMCCTAFVVNLFNFFFKRRSREIDEGEANDNAATNNGIVRAASSPHTSTEGRGMITSSSYDYEVFLSFKGSDTRERFTDFLYTSLEDVGLRAFKDDEELRVGEEFAPELLKAINQSKISIPIFSKDYASSIWCLKELVCMVECWKTRGLKIMPIFYDVTPSEVRYQTQGYGEAFRSHKKKKRYDEETMGEWKAALSAVGAINGWDLQSMPNRREAKFAKKVTQEVFNELKKAYLVVSNNLVNVDHHVNEIMDMIGDRKSETRIIGIHGMGGIGKTTIAKIIYNKLSNNFENCCFLSNIREMSQLKGIECLQNQLFCGIVKCKVTDIRNIDEGIMIIKERLSNKRVLLLLDDVDEKNHIDALVGECDWFPKGSKVIITTRKKDILDVPQVDYSYEVNSMDPNRSLQLFSKHAFRRDYPLVEYINKSYKVINIAGGLPLALEVIGSLLSRTKKEMWDVILEKLENVPHAEVQSKLKISYDALDFRQKCIFLDIACLFIGYDKDVVVHFWDESKLFPEEAMEVLQNMSLIKIKEDKKIWMHDQLRDLGREIVHQESNNKIQKQSRVWNPAASLAFLRRHEGEIKVEALRLKSNCTFTYEDFMRLSNLRFLEVVDNQKVNYGAESRFLQHKMLSNVPPGNVFQENSNLLLQLQWLSWHNIPQILDITNFSGKNMVILDLSNSKITQHWNGWSHMKVMKKLKVLNLTECCCLERTPNFSAQENLQHLILQGCVNLVEIDRSIGQLKHLVSLDIRYCSNLRRLPIEPVRWKALEELLIDSTLIKEIPNCQGMKNLRIFTASNSAIITLPHSIGELTTLEYLSLDNCRCLERLPDSIVNLESLIEMDIRGTMIKKLPDSIGNLKNLKVVKMTGSLISKIPDTLWTMEKLEEIEAAVNQRLHVKIGNGIYRSQSLRILNFGYAKIYTAPKFPESLISLHLSMLYMKTFPDLSNLSNLKELYLSFDARTYDVRSYELPKDAMPWWIGKLSKLESLSLSSSYVTTLPTDISLLPQLKALDLACSNLCCLPRLPSSLLSLFLCNCRSICSTDLSNLKKLSSLTIQSSAITEIRGLNCLENLEDLHLYCVAQLNILPDISNLKKLKSLRVRLCGNLVEIQGKLPQSLEELMICSCDSLRKLPDLSSFRGKKRVDRKANLLLCQEKFVEFEGDETNKRAKIEYEYGSEGEDSESKYEYEGDETNKRAKTEYEYGSEGEDSESKYESEGEDSESKYESEGEYEE